VRAAARWIAGNLPLMVLSLILSVLVWLVATEESDPTRTLQFPQSVPVVVSNLPEGMVVVGHFSERVRVTLRTTASVWDSLSSSDFNAKVDLAGFKAGEHRVPVELAVAKQPVRVLQVEPDSVKITLESSVTRTVPVDVRIEGEPPLGYLRRSASVEPYEVKVSGPQSYVERVAEVNAVVSVDGVTADVEDTFVLKPLDSEGHVVEYVTLTPDAALVRIPIELSGYYRQLAVRVITSGDVASGYRVTNISVSPSTVTVFGSPDVIAALPGFIQTEPIDLDSAKADVVVRPMLELPDNVGVVSGDQLLEVRVFVEPIESSLTVDVVPELSGLGTALTATVSPGTIQVILSGSQPLLESMKENDVRVVLNLFGLDLGTHQIVPQVVVPEGVVARTMLPPTVQVEISVMKTPTVASSVE